MFSQKNAAGARNQGPETNGKSAYDYSLLKLLCYNHSGYYA